MRPGDVSLAHEQLRRLVSSSCVVAGEADLCAVSHFGFTDETLLQPFNADGILSKSAFKENVI